MSSLPTRTVMCHVHHLSTLRSHINRSFCATTATTINKTNKSALHNNKSSNKHYITQLHPSYIYSTYRPITSFTPSPTRSAVNHRSADDSGMDDLTHHNNQTQHIKHNTTDISQIERNAKQSPESTPSSTPSPSIPDYSTSTTQSASNRIKEQAKDKAVVAKGRLKQLWHQYGYVAIATYLVIYVGTLFTIYLLYHFKIINFDPMVIVRWLGIESHVSKYDPKAGEFALAWITTKLTEPIRLAATAMLTPLFARLLGRAPSKSVTAAL